MTRVLTPQARAEKCAALMMENDAASKALGMEIERIAPGCATLSMTITPQMLNGHGMCHGGFTFSLADSAFAFACNTYNQRAVAQQNQITYLAPGQAGERLIATAVEVSRSGRSGIFDVEVVSDSGICIAQFRGLSRIVKGQHFSENGDQI